MVQFLSIKFFCYISSTFVGFFKSCRFCVFCPEIACAIRLHVWRMCQRSGRRGTAILGFCCAKRAEDGESSYLILTSSVCLLLGTPSRFSCEGESGQEILHSPVLWNTKLSHHDSH